MCALCVMDQLLILTSLNVYGVRTSTQKLYRRDKCWEICCIVYLPSNIVFFCTHCVYKLPSALMAYDKTKEACSVVEDTITSKLKSLETTLTSSIPSLISLMNCQLRWSRSQISVWQLMPSDSRSSSIQPKKSISWIHCHHDCLAYVWREGKAQTQPNQPQPYPLVMQLGWARNWRVQDSLKLQCLVKKTKLQSSVTDSNYATKKTLPTSLKYSSPQESNIWCC